MKKKYLVRLEAGVWVAPWQGDPGRTLKIENAARYNTRKEAEQELTYARIFRPFEDAEILKEFTVEGLIITFYGQPEQGNFERQWKLEGPFTVYNKEAFSMFKETLKSAFAIMFGEVEVTTFEEDDAYFDECERIRNKCDFDR